MDYKTFSKEIIEKVNAIEAIIRTDTPNNPDPPVAIQNSAEFSAKESIPDYGTVSILIEKLNATKEIIKTAAPNKPAFSVAIRNYAEIEKTLRQSGLIQLDGQWVYPATGWISSDFINLNDGRLKILSEDFTVRTIDGRTIDRFSHQNIDTLRRDMLENNLSLPSSNNSHAISRRGWLIGIGYEQTYMCTEGGWINRSDTYEIYGETAIRHYPEFIPMDNSKDYCRVRFCTNN